MFNKLIMKKVIPHFFFTLILSAFYFNAYSQITTDSNFPYDSPIFLVDSLLLGEGVVATNHTFQGDPLQIGFFNGENSNIGLDIKYIINSKALLTGCLNLTIDRAPIIPRDNAIFPAIVFVIT
mgnify:CR=1 FL=1